jgi:hypothetical protein
MVRSGHPGVAVSGDLRVVGAKKRAKPCRVSTPGPDDEPMTDLGGEPTVVSRLVVAALAAMVLAVGAFWLWTILRGVLVAGVPSWVVGLLFVGLVVALAAAVDKVHHRGR